MKSRPQIFNVRTYLDEGLPTETLFVKKETVFMWTMKRYPKIERVSRSDRASQVSNF